MQAIRYSILICLLFPIKQIYSDPTYFRPEKIDHTRIRKFLPACELDGKDSVCPPGTMKPEGKLAHSTFLQNHWVEHYKDYNPATGIIERDERFPNELDYTLGAHMYLGRMAQSDYKKYETLAITPPRTTSCSCGQRFVPQLKKEDKIIGGTQYYPHKYPYLVSLFYANEKNHFCGATLVNDLFVITAAHCVTGLMPNDILIRLGAHRLDTYPSNLEPEEQIKGVLYIISHFRFNPTSGNTDIALLKMDSAAVYNRYVSPVCLPPSRTWVSEGKDVVVPGWGVEDNNSDLPTNFPKEAKLKAMARTTCLQNSDYPEPMIRIRNICAAGEGQDSCQGDSGGPLLGQLEDNRDYLLGIVSWGIGCNNTRFPGVYSKVQAKHLIQFLFVHTQEAVYCV